MLVTRVHALLVLLLQLTGSGYTVSGVVVDPSGAPIAGAHVRALVNGAAPVESTAAPDGTFGLGVPSNVPLRLVVSADGFADQRVRVERDSDSPLRIVMQPRGITETVEVSADPDALRVSTPASATVLDREAVALASALTVDDQLRSVPGFSLFRRSSSRVANPTTQGVTLRGLTASGASRTAVFADGIPLNDPFGGWVYWDRVPVASIERIEVTRGGVSDLHGSDALGGAIRIDTSTDSASRIWLDAGSDATARLSAYTGVGTSRLNAFVSGEIATTDGFIVVAPESRGPIDVPAWSESASGAAGLSAPVTDRLRLEGRGSYFTEDRGNGTPFQTNATIVRQFSGLAAGDVAGGMWTLSAFGASQDYDQTFSAVADDRQSERPTTVQHVDTASVGVTTEWVRGGPRYGLFLSGVFRRVAADLFQGAFGAPQTLTAAGQRTGAVTAQLSLQPSGRVTVGAGLRGEVWRSELRDTGEGRSLARLLPRASVAVRLNDAVSVRAAIHHAYRTPTINELYRPFRVGAVLTRANAALGPENSYGLEGAVLIRRGRAAARGVAFWTRLDDAIVNVTLQSTPAIIRERQNAGRIRAAGVEVEGEVRAGAFSFTGAAAYIDSIFTEGAGLDGLRVPQVPRWQVSAGLQGNWTRAVASIDWRFIGEQFDDDLNQFLLDPSSIVNARAGWRIRPSLELFAAVENTFDAEQDVGRTPLRTIGLPRTARLGLRWTR